MYLELFNRQIRPPSKSDIYTQNIICILQKQKAIIITPNISHLNFI